MWKSGPTESVSGWWEALAGRQFQGGFGEVAHLHLQASSYCRSLRVQRPAVVLISGLPHTPEAARTSPGYKPASMLSPYGESSSKKRLPSPLFLGSHRQGAVRLSPRMEAEVGLGANGLREDGERKLLSKY